MEYVITQQVICSKKHNRIVLSFCIWHSIVSWDTSTVPNLLLHLLFYNIFLFIKYILHILCFCKFIFIITLYHGYVSCWSANTEVQHRLLIKVFPRFYHKHKGHEIALQLRNRPRKDWGDSGIIDVHAATIVPQLNDLLADSRFGTTLMAPSYHYIVSADGWWTNFINYDVTTTTLARLCSLLHVEEENYCIYDSADCTTPTLFAVEYKAKSRD